LKRVRCLTMSAPMIRAYQAGLKWQTRRVVRPDLWPIFEESARTNAGRASHQMLDFDVPCPYGEAGDELLLREPHKIEEVYPCGPHRMVRVRYLADDSVWDRELTMNEHAKLQARKYPLRAQPGRFMYRSLCRYRAGRAGAGHRLLRHSARGRALSCAHEGSVRRFLPVAASGVGDSLGQHQRQARVRVGHQSVGLGAAF